MNNIDEYKFKYKPSEIDIYVKNKDSVMHELSLIAISKSTNGVIAVGNEAREVEQSNTDKSDIVVFSPLRYGFIAEYTYAVMMFKYFIKKSYGKLLIKPKAILCIPSEPTEVELKVYSEIMLQCGVKEVQFSHESAVIVANNFPDDYKMVIGISYKVNKI